MLSWTQHSYENICFYIMFRCYRILAAHIDDRPTLSSTNIRGRRLALETTAIRSPSMHRRTALKASFLAFLWKDESLAAVRSNRQVAFLTNLFWQEGDTAVDKKSRSLISNIRIILSIFVEHTETKYHGSVVCSRLANLGNSKSAENKLVTPSYSLANYGVVLKHIYAHGFPRTS